MIASVTNVRLTHSDSAAQSRKYWKKYGKKINARKRQRRKSGMVNTTYTNGDYKWVKDTINQYQKNGISRKGLWKISSEQPRLGLRSELPPGRDKISQIVTDGDGKDWKVTKSVGGRGKHTVIHPIRLDIDVVIERLGAVMIPYSTMVKKLKTFSKMGNIVNEERFKREDFFLYAELKEQMFSLPMKIFLMRGRSGSDKTSIFNAVVSEIQGKHFKVMRKIENDQKSLKKEFPLMLEHVQNLRKRNVEELVFRVPKQYLPKNIVPETNALRSYFASY